VTKPNKFLRGHQGKSFLDSGFIYAPEIPLQMTPLNPCPPEPGAVDRLAGVSDPEARQRCDDMDDAVKEWKALHEFKLKTFDMVSDPSLPSAVPFLTDP
jgi:hypothetical protein